MFCQYIKDKQHILYVLIEPSWLNLRMFIYYSQKLIQQAHALSHTKNVFMNLMKDKNYIKAILYTWTTFTTVWT